MARNSRSKCMRCSKPPVKQFIWAEGRARAWFCAQHTRAFAKEHRDDIQSVKSIKGKAVAR
jgi:hypothetical protein